MEKEDDESIKMIVSTHKMLLHDYTKLLNMLFDETNRCDR